MYWLTEKTIFVAIAATFVVCVAAFYLTPLKHIAFIEPKVHDETATELYTKMTANPEDYIFIDVRGTDAYNFGHAEGSISMPLHTLYSERKNLPKVGKTIVLICSGGSASGVAYSYLQHFGFFNIVRSEGGVEAWEAAGLPMIGKIF